MQGLYEIEREYNLSSNDIDLGGESKPACAGGTFNQLIAKLIGTHEDCEITFITSALASLKLPKVVHEEMMQYLQQIPLKTASDLLRFTQLLHQIESHGLEIIWDKIKAPINDRIFNEFGDLYISKNDQKFVDLIEGGRWIKLPDFNIQQLINDSAGYHQYCSVMLRQSGLFGGRQLNQNYLDNHRHDNPETQQAYDNQYGLVLR